MPNAQKYIDMIEINLMIDMTNRDIKNSPRAVGKGYPDIW